MSYVEEIDRVRHSQGLLSMDEVCSLAAKGNVIFDPLSVLISRTAEIGSGNVFYPCTSFLCHSGSALRLGNKNTFRSMFLAFAENGNVVIGDGNVFGDGGVFLKANRPGARITVGDHGRYLGGATVVGDTSLGSGSQVLGAIIVDSCRLEAGGSHLEPDPDRRAGLLKGQGTARGLNVPIGQVISGQGIFSAANIRPQSAFHQKAAPR